MVINCQEQDLIVANLVLQDAIERIFVGDIYGDIYAGIYVIRGENVVLLGEIVLLPWKSQIYD